MNAQILFIDDDQAILKSTAARLREVEDYDVIEAATVDEGKALFNTNKTTLDLVIADMNFGSDDPEGGLRIVQFVRENQLDYVPVIVLTGKSEMNNAIKCMESGAFSYVAKAVENDTTYQTLKHTIMRALDLRWSRLKADEMALVVCAMVDSHEPYTGGHCWRVGEYAKIVAEKFKLPPAQLMFAERAGMVHDLAKVGIDAEVLARPARLSKLVMASIEAHPVQGYEMLKDKVHPVIAKAVLEHHKRIDGGGYPKFHKDLTGNISLIGQIIGVVDSFDAMTTPRPYMGGNGRDLLPAALAALKEDAQKGQYNQDLVSCLDEGMPDIWKAFKSQINNRSLPHELLKRNIDAGADKWD